MLSLIRCGNPINDALRKKSKSRLSRGRFRFTVVVLKLWEGLARCQDDWPRSTIHPRQKKLSYLSPQSMWQLRERSQLIFGSCAKLQVYERYPIKVSCERSPLNEVFRFFKYLLSNNLKHFKYTKVIIEVAGFVLKRDDIPSTFSRNVLAKISFSRQRMLMRFYQFLIARRYCTTCEWTANKTMSFVISVHGVPYHTVCGIVRIVPYHDCVKQKYYTMTAPLRAKYIYVPQVYQMIWDRWV